MRLLLPLVVAMMGLTDTICNYFAAGRILARLGTPVPTLPPFSRWRFSQAFLYLFGFSLVGIYWGQTRDLRLLYQAALNFNMLATMAGLVEGLSLFAFFTSRLGWGGFLKGVALALIFLGGPLSQILAFAGLLDTACDFRGRYERTA